MAEDRSSKIENRGNRKGLPARPWRIPLLAGIGTLCLVMVSLAWIVHLSENREPIESSVKSAGAHFQAGEKHFRQGQFHEAVRELEAALALEKKHPHALSGTERKRLVQMHREARLFVDLLSESVEEVVAKAAAEPDDREWQAVFAQRYQGKSAIFQSGIHRNSSNHWELDYEVFLGNRRARIDWENLQLLQSLPLNGSERLLLGVRLAKVEPEAGASWVIRLQPDSGVLLTDGDAMATVFSRPPEGIDEVLQRQGAWVTELP